MEQILSGGANDALIAALLIALRMKGETVDELVGFASAMRRHAVKIFPEGRVLTRNHLMSPLRQGTAFHPEERRAAVPKSGEDSGVSTPEGDARAHDNRVHAAGSGETAGEMPEEIIVDTCGTGGDGCDSFNISTAAAFVVAGAGVRVAKHGNRAASSRCGAADVLEQLGVAVEQPPERIRQAIEEIGIGFLFAPAIHTAMKYAMPARRVLGMRTAFNLLGPLTNPAGAAAQIVGVSSPHLTELLARALAELGVRRAFVVHGADGLDEISLSGETFVAELHDGSIRSCKIAPEDFGLRRAPLEAIAGGDAKHNAEIIHKIFGRSLLYRAHTPHRDIVLANASAALVAAGRAADFKEGVRIATESIDSGAAREKLDALARFTQATNARTSS